MVSKKWHVKTVGSVLGANFVFEADYDKKLALKKSLDQQIEEGLEDKEKIESDDFFPKRAVIADNFYNIAIFDNTAMEKSLQLTKNLPEHHPYSKAMSVSSEGKYVAVGLNKTTQGIVLEVNGNDFSKKGALTWQKRDITNITFSPNSKYLATGGYGGRTVIYSMPNPEFLTTLPIFSDYVSALFFDSQSEFLAAFSFSKTGIIFDLSRNIVVAEIQVDHVVEAGFFINEDKLFCVTREGNVLFIDIKQNQIISDKVHYEGAWLLHCVPIFKDYALVAEKMGNMFIVRLTDNQLMHSINLENGGISALKIKYNCLLIGFVSGGVLAIDINAFEKEFFALLKEKKIQAALELSDEKNMFLRCMPEFDTCVEAEWKRVLQEAIDLLAKDQLDEVTKMVKPFMRDPVKKKIFDEYWQQKEFVAKFMDMMTENNYLEAYRIAELHPEVRDTLGYAQLENLWQKSFNAAKQILTKDAKLYLQKAQEILQPFAKVKGKSELVNMLLRNSDKFATADKELKNRNFSEFFRLCEKFPFLKESDNYRIALVLGDQISQRINMSEENNDFEKALELCKLLATMLPFKAAAAEKTEQITLKRDFIVAVEGNNLVRAFELIEEHSELKPLKEYKKVFDDFQKCFEEALKEANKGMGSRVLSALKDYLKINYWKQKISATMRVCYLNEFKLRFKGEHFEQQEDDEIDWKETFKRFVSYYGKDESLRNLAEELGLGDEVEKAFKAVVISKVKPDANAKAGSNSEEMIPDPMELPSSIVAAKDD